MSYQRPTTGMAGSASYSEFLKDIYSSLRTLTTGLSMVSTRLDSISTQLQNFESRLTNQDQRAEFLAARIDTLIQQTQNNQIRQSTNSLSLLSELDTLGTRQVEPSTGLAELGLNSKNLFDRPTFKFPSITLPEITISDADATSNLTNLLEIDSKNKNTQPSTTNESEITPEQISNTQSATANTNFLILD